MKFAPLIVGLLVVMLCTASCSAIEQPPCYKNVKPPVREYAPWNVTPTQMGAGFMVPALTGLKELQARFG